MTSAERREIRTAILALGFHRVGATHDSGDGKYSESWRKPNHKDLVIVSWDKKDPDSEEL